MPMSLHRKFPSESSNIWRALAINIPISLAMWALLIWGVWTLVEAL